MRTTRFDPPLWFGLFPFPQFKVLAEEHGYGIFIDLAARCCKHKLHCFFSRY
jgi:hypothetical protein